MEDARQLTEMSVTNFVIQPSANLGVQLAPAAPGCSGVQFRTYYGLNLGLSLNEIEVKVSPDHLPLRGRMGVPGHRSDS
ncbi:hypothetical protein HaLaN_16887 [Haematococcus lacustris]|uniref:Uncharacterized protein n=1 Tax=Haematococcus lacustris TaxID=44745 RepID=A0A699ZM22_HAELA|nr:hypothetical protein HaLaN_16887 [Haematococcus lacustris]